MKVVTHNSPSRLMEIEKNLKLEKSCQKKPFFSSPVGSNVLRVTNNNGSSFVMAMPRGDSPIIEGLAARKAEANSLSKTFSNLVIK